MQPANPPKPSLTYNLLDQFARGNSQRGKKAKDDKKKKNLWDMTTPAPAESPKPLRKRLSIENLVDFATKGLSEEVRKDAIFEARNKTQKEMVRQVVKDDKKWKEFQSALKVRRGSTGLSQSESIRMVMTEQKRRDAGHHSTDSMQNSFSTP